MTRIVQKNHPRDSQGNKFSYKQIVKNVDVGDHGCFTTSHKT